MSDSNSAVIGRENAAFSTKDISFTAMFAVLIAVCSWISVPMSVPFTLQTFAVFCAVTILGGKRGTFSVLVFLLLGAVGVPVFAGFSGGIGVILGSTGGYMLGFIFIGLIYLGAEKLFGEKLNIPVKAAVLLIGLLVCYTFGTAWFMHIYTKTNGAISLSQALKWCVIPFIIPDIAKLAAALLISERLKKYVRL